MTWPRPSDDERLERRIAELAVLESWLGTQLFENNRRHMTATPAGSRLASTAGAALDLLASAVDSLMPADVAEVLDVIALEACLAGQGALAAPMEVVGDLLARCELVESFRGFRIIGSDYRLGYAPAGVRAALAASFAEWAVRTATSDPGLPAPL